MQCPGGRQPFDQLTANNAAGHRCDVEPQPLLIDESIGSAELLAVFDENGAAYRARYRHPVGGKQQRDDDLARRGNLRDPAIGACGHHIGKNKVALPAVAKERQEIRNDPVDRLDDPGKVEHRQIGGDLDRRPPVGLLQKIIERLGDQAAGLPDAFDDIDQREKHHEPADLPALVISGGDAGRRWRSFGVSI